MKTKNICFIALFAAILCVLAPISIPMVPVPITLATFAVYVIGSLFDWKRAPAVVCIYILIGAIGLPVFSSYTGGLAKLVGPTGGYIFGYILCVVLESVLISKFKTKFWVYPVAMVGGTVLIYLFGTAWFLVVMDGKYTIAQAMMACVVPFLIGDGIKIALASLVGFKCRRIFDKFLGIPYEKEEGKEELVNQEENN